MGDKQVLEGADEAEAIRAFTKRLLRDLRALEQLIADGKIESGVRRIGAEQEVFLVDRDWRPAPTALKVIERANDPHFTTEVALFNLELNLSPVPWGGKCLSQMEGELLHLLDRARTAAAECGTRVVLTGILPTIRKSDLGLENMTPIPRYFALNRAMNRLRGGDFELHIKGVDELLSRHDSVMVEACNASFQAHFQVGAAEFAKLYNVAQVATAPVLAAATNSPMLFGRRLWHETRIATFQQSVDTRSSSSGLRESMPRVDFGRQWVRESVVELFQEGISRYRVLIATEPDEDPFAKIKRGEAPELRALRLHNGTIYRWNRACYGVIDGKPHLRIEARALPSGPTPADEIANAALWYGLVNALACTYEDVTKHISFDDAKGNFLAAARLGLGANFTWLDGTTMPAQQLLLDRLIPMAREGLREGKLDEADIDRYLGIVQERVATGRSGSWWMLKSFSELRRHGTEGEQLNALTAATLARQKDNQPVAQWDLARLDEAGGWKHNYVRVEQFMGTDFVTVHEDDAIDLVTNLMIWERVRHVCVEDAQHRLVGIVSYRAILRMMAQQGHDGPTDTVPVSKVMKRDPWTVAPETSTLTAINVMRQQDVGFLPVINRDGRLVGMVTARFLMAIAAELLEQKLKG